MDPGVIVSIVVLINGSQLNTYLQYTVTIYIQNAVN